MGSLGVATLLYILMAVVITSMVPYSEVDVNAPFSAAFIAHGMPWAAKLVSVGAVSGIITSTMTGLLGQARLLVVLGRQQLLPGRLAAVQASTGTPVVATIVGGVAAGAMRCAHARRICDNAITLRALVTMLFLSVC